jgi:hypothetical protein
VNAIAGALLWLAVTALAYLLLRTAGWARVKQYWLAAAVLALALSAVPAAGVIRLAWPYRYRIMARLIWRESPDIVLRGGCSIFPANNVWNTRVRHLPVDARSAVYIQSMGPDLPFHLDFSVPYNVVDGQPQTTQVVFTDGAPESDPGPYGIPDNAALEPGTDAHLLAIDVTACRLYELFSARRLGPNQWEASSGAIYDLRSHRLRPAGWTSADAAGLPILAGLIRYDEVRRGRIPHALRFTTRLTRREFVWPARHQASRWSDPRLPPMGQRFRLRDGFDITGFSPEAQVILSALKEYGMLLSDNGGPWYLTGSQDSRWSRKLMREFRTLKGSDFEAVDSTKLMIQPDSGEARQ